jgi:hypothetical protein
MLQNAIRHQHVVDAIETFFQPFPFRCYLLVELVEATGCMNERRDLSVRDGDGIQGLPFVESEGRMEASPGTLWVKPSRLMRARCRWASGYRIGYVWYTRRINDEPETSRNGALSEHSGYLGEMVDPVFPVGYIEGIFERISSRCEGERLDETHTEVGSFEPVNDFL